MSTLLTLLLIATALTAVPVLVGAAINAVERGERVRLDRALLSRLLREYGAHLLVGPLSVASVFDPGPTPSTGLDSGRTPVLLVPGYAMNRACFLLMATYLRNRNWRWVWPINGPFLSNSVATLAQDLAQAVALMKRTSGADRVDLVGHSMGGVVAAWYIAKLGGAEHVRRLVTIGTPWKGTGMWVFGRGGKATELRPGSELLEEIAEARVHTIAIWSAHDHMMSPTSTCRLEHAEQPRVRSVEIPDADHLEMLMSPRVWRVVRDALTEDDLPTSTEDQHEEAPEDLPEDLPEDAPTRSEEDA